VLATGGSPVWNDATNAELRSEIWDPATGQWTLGASGALPRLYHSVGLLLPDASVMVGAGGAPGPYNNTNTEIYYPPYLFAAGGQRAARPAITDAPMQVEVGRNFSLSVSSASAIARVTFIKTGSVTHGWNMEQRFQDLTFKASGNQLTVQAPARAGDAPPGYYMVFVIDAAGVPSVARIVSMGIAANPNPAVVPALANPGNQATLLNNAVNLQLAATDPNGDVLSYAASGLPTGLSINPATGLVSGTATATGSFNVVLSVSDGVNNASASLVWTVSVPGQLGVQAVANPVASASGAAATFSAAASGGVNPRYSWNFGDGSAASAWSASGSASHVYASAGTYSVTLSITDDTGAVVSRSLLQTVYLPATAKKPTQSSPIVVETPASGNPRIWAVNPDNDSVTAIDAITGARLAEVAVGANPRSLALSASGELWVVNKRGASISVINTATRAVTRTLSLPRASQPHGIAMSPTSAQAFVALEASGQLLKIDTGTYATTATLAVGENARQVSVSADGASVYVTRFITPPLPGEGTAAITPGAGSGGVVVQVGAASMAVVRNITLAVSTVPDAENQGRGVPNYLGAASLSPDGTQAFVPSKQDNVQRGALRDGTGLNFQNTVRAVSSRLLLASGVEDLAARIDHDNASLASAAVFDARGVFLFVALETSREIAVLDAHGRRQLLRVDTGRAPQGLALSADGRTLYAHNFMDRSVGAYDLRPLLDQGLLSLPLLATVGTVATDKLGAQVLLGKQLFYDARDTRLARDRYMSCAACHQDGGHDGRVWDLTGFGEGLRNTISLRGRAGMAQGRLHWSANFDEVQDFEGQIRALAGGTGLMNDTAFNAGTRSQPLGDTKAGQSADLDALAAYVASLNSFEPSPWRNTDGSLTAAATAGRSLFGDKCAGCHGGAAYTNSASGATSNVGTLKPASGGRLGGALTGLDTPTLRDAWATGPYLHDGSAATLEDAVRAHTNLSLGAADLANVAAFVRQVGSEEAAVAAPTSGLRGEYFNNATLAGVPVLTRYEAVNFSWGSAAPDASLPADNFSVRWSGFIKPTSSGSFKFQTYSDDGVRVWVNGVQLVNNWTDHSPTTNSSASISLSAGQRYSIRVEYYERGGGATMQLRWLTPGAWTYSAVPQSVLAPN
jgi:YVTN family beta-propeller protein